MILKYKNKKIKINPKNCNYLERVIGLMFKTRENAGILLFDFKKPVKISIHSLFVFFPFIAIWLDDKNNVIDLKVVKPFSLLMSPRKSFYKIVEIPINERHQEIIKILVGNRKV